MVLVTIVGLYTSRVVLEALGVDDYGIYGVVGGIVGMASFLNSSMAGATSRFITCELGRGDHVKLRTIFSSALIIHLAIAIVVAILAETVGLWFVNHCMNFPPDRMFAVNVLYQFTILSMMVSFTQVPYSAAIIAHERISIYAYFEILNVTLKLVIVYLLLLSETDRLILYAALQLAVSVLMAFIYRIYCLRQFPECHFTTERDSGTVRDMLKFAGLDLYGNICAVAKNQGQPVILNMFFGVVANAGASIALIITGAISGFTTTIMQAFRPQIIKQYSAGHLEQCETAARRSAQFTILAYSAIAIPVVIWAPSILYLWLGQIPNFSVEFIRIIVLSSLFNIIINVNNACIHATGNIKNISFISGTAYLLCPILSFIWMLNKGPIVSGYIIDTLMLFVIANLGFFFIKKQIPNFGIASYLVSIYKTLITIGTSLVIVLFVMQLLHFGPLSLKIEATTILQILSQIFISTIVSLLVLMVLAWTIALKKDERGWICGLIRSRFQKFQRNSTDIENSSKKGQKTL